MFSSFVPLKGGSLKCPVSPIAAANTRNDSARSIFVAVGVLTRVSVSVDGTLAYSGNEFRVRSVLLLLSDLRNAIRRDGHRTKFRGTYSVLSELLELKEFSASKSCGADASGLKSKKHVGQKSPWRIASETALVTERSQLQ